MAAIRLILIPLSVAWREFCNILSYIFREGAWKIRPLHQKIVDELLKHLDTDVSNTVKLQLNRRYFVMFMSKGRINSIYFDNLPKHLIISDKKFEECAYKIDFFANDQKNQSLVSFSRGRIFSIDFKKPYKFFAGKDIRMGASAPKLSQDSYAGIIDRAAHGKERDHNP